MALPRTVCNTLENIVIPLKGIFYASLATCVLTGAAAITLPQKPALASAKILINTIPIGLASGLTCIGIGGILIRDSKERQEALSRQHQNSDDTGLDVENTNRDGECPSQAEQPNPDLQPVNRLLSRFSWLGSHSLWWSDSDWPAACSGCKHYHGKVYYGEKGRHQLICAMYPSGPIADLCPDWEVQPCLYGLTRLQGIDQTLYFVRLSYGWPLSKLMEEAVPVESAVLERLQKRFRLKSINGLPGRLFTSNNYDIEQAYQELLDSCPTD